MAKAETWRSFLALHLSRFRLISMCFFEFIVFLNRFHQLRMDWLWDSSSNFVFGYTQLDRRTSGICLFYARTMRVASHQVSRPRDQKLFAFNMFEWRNGSKRAVGGACLCLEIKVFVAFNLPPPPTFFFLSCASRCHRVRDQTWNVSFKKTLDAKVLTYEFLFKFKCFVLFLFTIVWASFFDVCRQRWAQDSCSSNRAPAEGEVGSFCVCVYTRTHPFYLFIFFTSARSRQRDAARTGRFNIFFPRVGSCVAF